ncbi:lysoplasmalogenase [Arthrobacter sp. zg-Y820]|uniref:lysoplasmalogenase n=1 Tax=unclassified Arthrobacter TaxID=235627 RepID=UPI0025410A7D|nr:MULTISPECIES: lysoplasmalogenase [unclassified Arthrobacter]MCC9196342.1 lysoplasmalogenase [Arthrobacter sp. zg-Y820]MDK1279203.1 lysoplasmalogenase [Arthrobacter sp. zg.Y820]WIB08398.1 lysoplasmalogenase [Arthrobacter sp. zg-Y820]
MTPPARDQTAALPRALPRYRYLSFLPFAAVSAVHIGARALGADEIAEPTKLALMPLLAAAALWGGRGFLRGTPALLLLAALLFSWLGDGAGTFFPFAPELPVMLGSFGLAHLCYIWLLGRYTAVGPFPGWSLAYAAWWLLMLLVLWPTLGGLTLAVAAYGLVLAGTAATAARCRPMVAVGGLLFLASDTVLALRIFMPDAMPEWSNPLVMLTYCAGQGLLVAGVLRGAVPHGPATGR